MSQETSKEPIRHVTIRIPDSMHKQASQQATKEHISLNSWFLRMADASLATTRNPQGAAA